MTNAAEMNEPEQQDREQSTVDPIVIRRSDVGRHVFTPPELFCDGVKEWLASPNSEVDTEAIILLDEATERLGYVHIRDHRHGDCKNARNATMWIICENRYQTFYRTQEDACRAALRSEREYATNILRACDAFEKLLDG